MPNTDAQNTLLFSSINDRDMAVVQQLLEHGVEVNTRWQNSTPLIECLRLHNTPEKHTIFTHLLTAGADVNYPNRKYKGSEVPPSPVAYPIHAAADDNNPYYLQMLLKHGADPLVTLPNDETVLFNTLCADNTATMETLIEAARQAEAQEKFQQWLDQRSKDGTNILHRTIKMYDQNLGNKNADLRNQLLLDRVKILVSSGASIYIPAKKIEFDKERNNKVERDIFPLQLIDEQVHDIRNADSNWQMGVREAELTPDAKQKIINMEIFKSDIQRIVVEFAPRFTGSIPLNNFQKNPLEELFTAPFTPPVSQAKKPDSLITLSQFSI